MRGKSWSAAVAAVILATSASCTRQPARVTNAIPADSTAVALVDLAGLRESPAYGRLPGSVSALVQPLAAARELAITWNGADLLLLAAVDSLRPPDGYILLAPGIAATGTEARLAAARQALSRTATIAVPLPGTESHAQLRAGLRGDGKLPLPGDLENLGTLLRMADSTTLLAHFDSSVAIDLSAQCRSADRAQRMEESMRAMVTLLSAASKNPEVRNTLRGIQISRDNLTVRVSIKASPEALSRAF